MTENAPKRAGIATLAQLQNTPVDTALPPAGTVNVDTTKRDPNEPIDPVEPVAKESQADLATALAAQLLENERAELARQQNEALRKAAAPNNVVFMTRYPSLIIYVPVKGVQRRLDFQHGILRVDDPAIADAIRESKRFKSGMIRETAQAETAAMKEAIERRRDVMKAATQGGIDTSTFGSDAAYMAQSGELDSAELRLMSDL